MPGVYLYVERQAPINGATQFIFTERHSLCSWESLTLFGGGLVWRPGPDSRKCIRKSSVASPARKKYMIILKPFNSMQWKMENIGLCITYICTHFCYANRCACGSGFSMQYLDLFNNKGSLVVWKWGAEMVFWMKLLGLSLRFTSFSYCYLHSYGMRYGMGKVRVNRRKKKMIRVELKPNDVMFRTTISFFKETKN